MARCRVGHHLAPALAGKGSEEGSGSAEGFGGQLGLWSRGLPPLPPHLFGSVSLSHDRFCLSFWRQLPLVFYTFDADVWRHPPIRKSLKS